MLFQSNGSELLMNIFSKPNNTRRCLRFESNHPIQCTNNNSNTFLSQKCTVAEDETLKQGHPFDITKSLEKYIYLKRQ